MLGGGEMELWTFFLSHEPARHRHTKKAHTKSRGKNLQHQCFFSNKIQNATHQHMDTGLSFVRSFCPRWPHQPFFPGLIRLRPMQNRQNFHTSVRFKIEVRTAPKVAARDKLHPDICRSLSCVATVLVLDRWKASKVAKWTKRFFWLDPWSGKFVWEGSAREWGKENRCPTGFDVLDVINDFEHVDFVFN